MKTGRELDRLVAEKVMGWTNISGEEHWLAGFNPQSQIAEDVPNYSYELSDTWTIVMKLAREAWVLRLECWGEAEASAEFSKAYTDRISRFTALSEDSVCVAICLAALKACGYTHSV